MPRRTERLTGLAASCRDAFTAADRERGREYFHAHRVRLVATGDSGIDAEVRGTRRYPVSVRWDREPGTLRAECGCPRFADTGACKHLWAVLLAADERRLGPVWSVSALVHHEWRDLPEAADLDDSSTEDVEEQLSLSALPSVPWPAPRREATPRPTPPSAWRTTLSKLAAVLEPKARHRPLTGKAAPVEIWFAIDLQAVLATGELTLVFYRRRQRREGTFGTATAITLDRELLAGLPAGEERQVLELLRELAARWNSSRGYPTYDGTRVATIPASLYEHVLPRLAATGRLTWRPPGAGTLDTARPLGWDPGPPWRLRLQAARDREGRLTLTGELWRDDERRPLSDPLALTASGLVLFADTVARFEIGDAFPWVVVLRGGGPLVVPPDEETAAIAALFALPVLPTIDGADDILPRRETHPPRPRLVLHRRRPNEPRSRADVSFRYDSVEVTSDDARRLVPDPGTGRLLLRDPAAEAAALARLSALGAVRSWIDSGEHLTVDDRVLAPLVESLLVAGWEVEAEGAKVRRASSLGFSITSGIDWLDLTIAAEFNGAPAALDDLLAALARRDRFVRLGDGSRGMLPVDWLARYGALGRLADSEKDGALRFLPTQALLLDALLADVPRLDHDAAFARLRGHLLGAHEVPAAEPPAGFEGTLRAYQKQGLGWLQFLREIGFGGCLADDMGLGKTVQVLAQLVALRAGATQQPPGGEGGEASAGLRPSLVVAPRSVVHNWIDEAARFAPSLRVLDYSGLQRSELRPRFAAHDLIVTTYGVVRRDAPALRAHRFAYLILDEAQAVKNPATQAYKACRLLQADHRLALSGTPVENHLGELWSLLDLLNPGLLGRLRDRSSGASGLALTDAELAAVGRAVRPFLLRRTKEQVLAELPPKTEQTLLCTLPPPQRRLYDQLKRHYQARLRERIAAVGIGRSRIQVLEALLRLRQAACHAALIDPSLASERSAKLDTLLAQLVELNEEGHKALVFSQFTRLLALVKPRLDEAGITYEYLDGRTRDRRAKVARFTDDADCGVFLVSLKAGGLGLNLTAASYVFLLDPWWNPAVEAQAIDRAHRIGQHRPVFAYRLIAADTVEEHILELQRSKRRVAEAIFAADTGALGQLTAEDLELLLR